MAGPINWLSQVTSVSKFGLLSIPQRAGSVAAAVIGIAGVVAVLVGVLSMGAGFQKAMTASGSPDAAIVLRSGADSEMVSGFLRESTRIIGDAPGVARDDEGPLSSAELFVIINLPKRSTGTDANVPMRGVEHAALKVRDKLKLVDGRMFEWGKNEVIVGVGAANKRGDTFQSVYVKLVSVGAFQEFKDALTTDPRLNVKVLRQAEYYAEQSTAVTKLITTLGFLIAFLMAIGAVFGALNTMYSSVSARTREIATLRALGFGSGAVVVSVMIESLALAVLGGALGAIGAYFTFNGLQTATMNWQSFSQVTFAFAVTPELLVRGIVWAVLIGLIGGLFPALRGARLPIAAALREL